MSNFLNSTQETFRLIFTTNLLISIILALILFFVNGIIWISIFHYSFPFMLYSTIFAIGSSTFNIVIGYLYTQFLQDQMGGHGDDARLFNEFVLNIKSSAIAIAGLYNGRHRLKPTEMSSNIKTNVTNIMTAYQLLIVCAYKIFVPNNRDEIVYSDIKPIDIRANTQTVLEQGTQQIFDGLTKVFLMVNY